MKNCTVIILTFNRPAYLRRLLDYFNRQGGERLEFIVLDSSSKVNKEINRKIVQSSLGLLIKYYDYPEHIAGINKWSNGMKYVKTKYCVFCADDDFIIPVSIRQAVDFLEKNPDFGLAHGKYIAFYTEENACKEKIFKWRGAYPHKSIKFDAPEQRFHYHLSYYWPTIYAVHRTDTLKRSLHYTVEDSQLDPRLWAELLQSCSAIISGKVKSLECLYSAREDESTFSKNWPTIPSIIKDGTYQEKYMGFKKMLIKILTENDNVVTSKIELGKLIDKTMANHLKGYKPGLKHVLVTRSIKILKKIQVPNFLYQNLRKIYRTIYRLDHGKGQITTSSHKNISSYYKSEDYQSITEISDVVLSHSRHTKVISTVDTASTT